MITKDNNTILQFFLNIFKVQQNAFANKGRFIPLELHNQSSDSIYELQVKKQHGQQLSRRISIGPLGEDTGSKSTCFKVIYDDILVVKIPPGPIKNFNTYIQNIHSEKNITELLSPDIECIIPTVSAILRKLQPFIKDSYLDSKAFEEKCIAALKVSEKFQNYLKIGDSFAFFMNLSTYSFLGQVIRDMHFEKNRFYNEVLAQIDMLEYPGIFEDIYGENDTLLFYNISGIYTKYEEKINPVLEKYNLTSIPAYDKKEWFLSHLAEKAVNKNNKNLDPEFVNELNKIIKHIFVMHKDIIQNYRMTVKNHIYKKKFKKNKAAIQGLVINLLSMLAVLREKGVAVRDLKPDNVFIVGDLSRNPHLLASFKEYSIGLIDFETSVKFKTKADEKIQQPMLAGTPSYATPSHLFKNEMLCYVYKDLAHILHLQDWQAVNSMIYNVITGRRLSKETGRIIPGIVRTIKKHSNTNVSKPEVFINCNRVFWQKAVSEFNEKLLRYKVILKSVSIRLPKHVKKMFIEEACALKSDISKRIQHLVLSQKLFNTDKSRTVLIKATRNTIIQYKTNWEQGINIPKINPNIKKQVIQLLKNLEYLKLESDQIANFIKIMEQQLTIISAYEVMNFMFNIVFNAMYKAQCGEIALTNGKTAARDMRNETSKIIITDEDTAALESTIT